MTLKLFPWLLAYLGVSLPVMASWYAARTRRLWRYVRSMASRAKVRFLAALGRRMWRFLAEHSARNDEEESSQVTPLHPRN